MRARCRRSSPKMRTEAFAPAKINLALHVTGRREDGYHLLDSLVVFADIGDRVTATAADHLSLVVTGPMAAGLTSGPDNLVLRAARFLADHAGKSCGAALGLEKHLPVASGIGGGSSDAAAALRALSGLWRVACPAPAATLLLGADLPVCMAARPARMRGVGDVLEAVPPLPPLWLVLANPGVEVATGRIFAAITAPENPPLPDVPSHGWPDLPALIDWLRTTRNDLEGAACHLAPEIGAALAALRALPGCHLARMSGSGATCFAIFADPGAAKWGAELLQGREPGWWVVAAPLANDQVIRATT